MSDKKPTSSPPKNSKRADLVAHLKKVMATRTKLFAKKVGVIVAMLYIRGDNGRMSGRASGNVYMRNGRIRQFVVPRLVQNAYTATARTAFAAFSTAWSGLSQASQDTWNNVTDVFKSDRFGAAVLIRGKQLYIERNVNNQDVGGALLTTFPPAEPILGITSATLTATTSGGIITVLSAAFDPSPVDASTAVKVFGTPVLGNGINRPKASTFRMFSVIAGAATTPANLLADYTAKFGNVGTAGQKIFMKLVPVNINTGQAGVPLLFDAITT